VGVLSHESPGRQREWSHPGRPRHTFLDLDLEQARLRIDRLDRAREHDAAAMQEARTEDERRRLAARRVDDDAFDDADTRPVRLHAEALGSREPVLEHVAAPAEHVRPHTESVPNLRYAKPQEMPSAAARATASVLEPASSLRRIALTW
jgi:hypothetical protein